MREGWSSRWSQLVALLLAAALLYLAVRGVSWSEILETVRRGQPNYLAIACMTLTTSLFIRGLRWRILLSAEKPVPPLTVFWATCVGYLGNNFLPARAGEVIRSVLIGRATNSSSSLVLATALSERVMDVVALVLFGLLAMATLDGLPEWLLATIRTVGLIGLAALAGLVVVSRLEGMLKGAVRRLPFPAWLNARLMDMTGQFLLGMRAFQHRDRALGFAALTVVVWLLDGLGAVIAARALNLPPLSLLQALLLLATLGLSSAVPSTPGYVGIYQFVSVSVLPLFGFSQSQALAYAIVVQALSYGVITVWGLLGLWRLNSMEGRQRTARASLEAK